MASLTRPVTGLDLGSHSVKVVELRQGFRTAAAARAYECVLEGRSSSEVLRELVATYDLETSGSVAAVRSSRVSVRSLDFPTSSRRSLAQAVPLAIEDRLPFEAADVVIDWTLASRERGQSRVLAAIAPRAEISELVDRLNAGGCDPHVLDCEGLVLANLSATFDLPGTRILADLGHSKSTFCLLRDGRPLGSHALLSAGRQITEALAADRGIDFEAAESLKHESGVLAPGDSEPSPRVAAVIDRIANDLVRFVSSSDTSADPSIEEVTLMGGTALLEGIEEFIETRTGLRVRRIGLPREEAGLGLVAAGSPVLFAPAVALALRGSGSGASRLNFRRDEFSRRIDIAGYFRDFGSTAALCILLAVLALSNLAIHAYLDSKRATVIESEVQELYQSAVSAESAAPNPIASLRSALQDAKDRAEFLGVYRGNLSALDLLTEISQRISPELDLVFEELSIDRQTIRIRVFTESFEAADRLGAELSEFGPFSDTRIGAIETDKRSGRKKFDVTISLVEDRA